MGIFDQHPDHMWGGMLREADRQNRSFEVSRQASQRIVERHECAIEHKRKIEAALLAEREPAKTPPIFPKPKKRKAGSLIARLKDWLS